MARDSQVRRYLLFDSGCALCTRLAAAIEAEAGGRLEARSLRDPAVQALLNQAKAPPRWEPAVLEQYRGRVRVWYGPRMRLRLLRWLGPVTTWRVLRRIHALRKAEPVGVNLERRQMLSRGLAILGGLALWTGLGGVLSAGRALAAGRGGPGSPATPPGPQPGALPDHWLAHLEVLEKLELTGEAVIEARRALWNAPDTRELRWRMEQLGLSPEAAAVVAAEHRLVGGNTLLAVAAKWVTADGTAYYAGHYALRQPVRYFQTSTSLYRKRGQTLELLATSVNGRLVMAPVGAAGASIQSHCGGCVDPRVGPWSQNIESCSVVNWACVAACCYTCPLKSDWGLCLIFWCPGCLLVCCVQWSHGCTACPPVGSGPEE